MTLTGVAKVKWKLTHGLKNDIRNLVNLHASIWNPENLHFDWIRLSKAYIVRSKLTEELCLMTLKSDAKFGEKLTLGSKNDMRNLVNYNASSSKSGNLYFDVLLLSTAYKVSAEKVQKNYLSWQWKKIQTLKKKLTFYLKNEMRNLVNFNLSSGKSANLYFDGLLL